MELFSIGCLLGFYLRQEIVNNMEYLLVLIPIYIWLRYYKDHFLSVFSYSTNTRIIILAINEVREQEATQRYQVYYRYPVITYLIDGNFKAESLSKKNTCKIYEISAGGANTEFKWRGVVLPKVTTLRRNLLTQSAYISNKDLIG